MIFRISLIVFLVYLFNYTEARIPIEGVIAPVFTPYYKNNPGKINFDQIKPMAEYYASKGVEGIIVGAKPGEGSLLSDDETRGLFKAWVEAARSYGLAVLVVIYSTPQRTNLARYAESLEVDAILVLPQHFYQPMTTEAALADLKYICEKVKNTLVLLYIDPLSQPDYVRFEQLHYEASKQIENYGGLRCDIETALQIRSAGYLKPNQLLLISSHYSIGLSFFAKFNATVAVSNNIIPEMAVAVKNAKSREEVFGYMETINKIVRCVAKSSRDYITSLKATFEMMTGIDMGETRHPIRTITCQEKVKITKTLLELDIALSSPVEYCDDTDSEESDEDYHPN